MLANVSISEAYRGPLYSALLFSGTIAVLSALMLDGGEAARLSAIGLLVFWGWIFVGICKRPRNPTSFDLFLVRWGCLPLVLGFQVMVHVVWQWRGLE
jgi:hypothetical protein